MANIAIVNYCNLKCPYCFADDMIHEENAAMTMEDLRTILEFCSRVPMMNHIGIIGGEPTLHPQFDEILKEVNKYCRECDTDATIFTNGIELDKWLPYIGDRIGLLINCNNPADQSETNYEKHIATLDHLYELSWFERKANCGCNVHPGCEDYSYMWKIVDKYHLPGIRCSVVSPGGCYQNLRSDKEAYYTRMKPIFVNFCKEAMKHHCKLHMDCGHIPMCYFTMEEKEIVEEACDNLYCDFCEPVIDITPEFKATACFGAYDPIDIRDFKDLSELSRYLLLKKTAPRAAANCTGRCTTCKKHKLLQCQGGCLGFAEV
jgi:hypothetical protein